MNIGKRKHAWPMALALSLAVVGMLAAFIALAAQPGSVMAQGMCDGPLADLLPQCQDGGGMVDDGSGDGSGDADDPACDGPLADVLPQCQDDVDGMMDDDGDGMMMMEDMAPAATASSSTSASSTVEVKLTIDELGMPVAVGGSIVLYLEDDFAEPDSISASDVYFVSEPAHVTTGNGGRVYATIDPVISTNDYFTADKKDIAIQVFVPDMCPNATDNCEGDDGLRAGDTIVVVVTKAAGIKNPSEEGTHSTGYNVLPATHTGSVPSSPMATNILNTYSKIGLSDVDNKRGYKMTVTGSGFNDGTSASAYVLHIRGSDNSDPAMRNMYIWNALDCEEMNNAFGLMGADAAGMGTSPCTPYSGLSAAHKAEVDMAGFFSSGYAEAALCDAIIRSGTKAGSAVVGSDDKVTVTFEITAPTFGPGNTNHICMADGEGRKSKTDVEDFNLEASIKVVPSSVTTGDTVNVFAQDYQNQGQGFTQLKVAGEVIPVSFIQSSRIIGMDGSGSVTFEVPGGLEGVLRVDAQWGMDPNDVSKNSKITIAGADLNASKTDVRPNDTITITGSGFGVKTCVPESNITLDNVPVMVHPDSLADRCGDGVEVSNSGQFVATVILWPAVGGTNPTLIPGTHKLEVKDTNQYASSINLTIDEPSVTVSPDIAGPRDYITIIGENWPVDNLDNTLGAPVNVTVQDVGNGRLYPVYADSVGRFSVEHRIHRKVAIPDSVQVKATFGDVAKIGSFAVPASTITVTPNEGQPGDMVTLTANNMPVYTSADYVEIGGTTYDDPGVNTDRDGNITVEDVLIPGLDPGVYSVVINVDGTIAIGEVNVLAESSARGAPAELPGAVESLGDSVVAIFHFDDVGKSWSFYDPRPEFSDLNTLTEMVNGEAYWILVSETVEDELLNNKNRSLTCRGTDCWNLEVW